MKANEIEECSLIKIQWNIWNGFELSLISVEDRSLFAIYSAWDSYLTIHLLFFRIDIYDKFNA